MDGAYVPILTSLHNRLFVLVISCMHAQGRAHSLDSCSRASFSIDRLFIAHLIFSTSLRNTRDRERWKFKSSGRGGGYSRSGHRTKSWEDCSPWDAQRRDCSVTVCWKPIPRMYYIGRIKLKHTVSTRSC